MTSSSLKELQLQPIMIPLMTRPHQIYIYQYMHYNTSMCAHIWVTEGKQQRILYLGIFSTDHSTTFHRWLEGPEM